VKAKSHVKLASGVPFVDADFEAAALDKANADSKQSEAALDAYRGAHIDGLKAALAILGILVLVALFYAQRIPTTQPEAPEAAR
jgi:hypothetical protein